MMEEIMVHADQNDGRRCMLAVRGFTNQGRISEVEDNAGLSEANSFWESVCCIEEITSRSDEKVP
jgi:hypothetical protein